MRRLFFAETLWKVTAEISHLSLPSVYFYHLITRLSCQLFLTPQ